MQIMDRRDRLISMQDPCEQHTGVIFPMEARQAECQSGGRPDTQMSLIVHPQCLAGIHVFDFEKDLFLRSTDSSHGYVPDHYNQKLRVADLNQVD